MKTTETTNDGKRRYHMVEHSGFVRGEIMLRPDQVKQFSISLGVRLMRHLPQPKAYDVLRQEVVV